jgi:hypothetical protein
MKLKIFSLLLCAGLFTTSCSDMLDTVPQGKFTDEQLNDSTVQGLVAATYNGLEAHFFGNNEAFSGPSTNWIFDVRSDDALKGGGATSMEQNIHQLEISNITSDNASSDFKWKNNYYAIVRANRAIAGIENAKSIANPQQLIGEMKCLRAYYYFDLIRVFKRIPYFTDPNEDASSKSNMEFTRAEIYDKIIGDLTDAFNTLPKAPTAPGRVCKYTAAAILAKVYAQDTENGSCDWQKVKEWAKKVMDSGCYSLYPKCQDMAKIDNNNKYESILAIQCSTANNNAHINWSNLLNTTKSDGNLYGNGDDFFYGSQDLVDAFATDENGLPYVDKTNPNGEVVSNGNYYGNVDPRLDFTVGRIGFPFRGHTYTKGWCRAYDIYGEYSNKKNLCDPADPRMIKGWPWGGSPLNFCLIRYSDIVLLYAEACVETGDLEEARTWVNKIRQRAENSIDPSYTPQDLSTAMADYKVGLYPAAGWTQDYARKAVRLERRLELALEGNRWFDLQRWGNTVDVMTKYFAKEKQFQSYYQDASISDKDLFLKIYVDEVTNSHGLYTQY